MMYILSYFIIILELFMFMKFEHFLMFMIMIFVTLYLINSNEILKIFN